MCCYHYSRARPFCQPAAAIFRKGQQKNADFLCGKTICRFSGAHQQQRRLYGGRTAFVQKSRKAGGQKLTYRELRERYLCPVQPVSCLWTAGKANRHSRTEQLGMGVILSGCGDGRRRRAAGQRAARRRHCPFHGLCGLRRHLRRGRSGGKPFRRQHAGVPLLRGDASYGRQKRIR